MGNLFSSSSTPDVPTVYIRFRFNCCIKCSTIEEHEKSERVNSIKATVSEGTSPINSFRKFQHSIKRK